ncbi:MAG: adenylate/guanylate cyclase domain-containing protein [Xanthobacteraceae bacterium]|jgi:adenylate cyclase
MKPPPLSLHPVVQWLVHGARNAPLSHEVLTELCQRLVAAGLPLWRVMVFVRTLHPEIVGRRFVWHPETGTEVTDGSFELLERRSFIESPMMHVAKTGESFRRRLADPDCIMDYGILHELRAEGVTDYFVAPLHFSGGDVHFSSWSTRQPGGFTDAEIEAIEAIIPPLARIGEIRAWYRVASNLLTTYIGKNAGERVLAGHIRRGDTEAIHAAIWLSDMRGFTVLADTLPPQNLVDLLNRYFDCQVPAIEQHGGEVLKFMGDGLLAIFPIGAEGDFPAICASALAAGRAARDNIAALDAAEDGPALRFGLALHLGDVLFGNIGSGNRLDFTAIGPAVNLAARLEKLAGRLGRTILASEDFVDYCGDDGLQPVGRFAVAGFAAEQMVFGLADEGLADEGKEITE